MSNSLKFGRIKVIHWLFLVVLLLSFGVTLFHAVKPLLAELHFREGFRLGVHQRYRYAIEELEDTIRLSPWETHYQIQLGKYYEDYARKVKSPEDKTILYLRAEQLYKRIIQLDKYNPWYHNRIAVIYEDLALVQPTQADYYKKKAHDFVRSAALQDRKNPLFQLNYASYLHRNDDIEGAQRYYEKTLELDPLMSEAYYNLADIYRKQGKEDESLEQYETLYKLNPDFFQIKIALASAYIVRQRTAEAIPLLESIITEDPKHENVLRSLASIYYQEEHWANLRRIQDHIFTHFPDTNASMHPIYVQAIVNTSGAYAAIAYLERFLITHPDDTIARAQLDKLRTFLEKETQ